MGHLGRFIFFAMLILPTAHAHISWDQEGTSSAHDELRAASVHSRMNHAWDSPVEAPCADFKNREFDFDDSRCGRMQYGFDQLMRAHQQEESWWSEQATSNPWWAVLTGYKRGSELSVDAKLQFYETASADIDRMKSLLSQFHSVPEMGSALDLGCGLGRMSQALVSMGFQRVLCVDQAKSFLTEAKKTLTEFEGRGVIPRNVTNHISFLESGPDLSCAVKPGSVDFVHSILTLQHMKPQLQVVYIEQLCDALKPNGTGYFGIPVDINAYNRDRSTHCDLMQEKQDMMMHYTEEKEVVRHLNKQGCSVEGAVTQDEVGPIGRSKRFIFRKK